MTVNGSKSYIKYLNELVDQYKYTYRHSICRKSIIASYPALIEKNETNSKSPKSKVNDRVRINNNKKFVERSIYY